MAVGEVLLSALFTVLIEMLKSTEVRDFATQLVGGVDSELIKLEQTLRMVQALLNDAEDKQLTNGAVKLWLDNLQDWAYDAEDVLDEFSYEALRRNLKLKYPACMPNLVSCSVKFNFRLWNQIKDATSQLEQLCKQKNDLGLQEIPVGTSNSAPPRPPTTSLRTETAVYGRDEAKSKILKMVLRDKPCSDANFDVISIVGMGGLGKTTLAREVFNDKSIDDFEFDIKAWACVSDNFDVLRVSKALLESITSSPCHLNGLNEVQNKLKEAIDGKKFLLVLDYVWNKNYELWKNLKSPFMGGALGSKIIVTTREEEVASLVGTPKDNQYNLEHLSDDDCWLLFKKHAFERDSDADQISQSIREKVIDKCKGLPLAAMTLAGVLRTQSRDEAQWNDILDSDILDSKFCEHIKDEVLPVLRLSYHYLPSHLKRCFAYCSIFSKDYEFDETELILLWMAEGLILQSSGTGQPEDFGKEYFRDLVSRGLFQQSNTDQSKFVMHDLIHDLAQSISENTSFTLKVPNQQREKVRHASYGKNNFEFFHKFERLRTFIPLLMHEYDWNCISSMVLVDLLPKFKKLRVLSLAGSYITQLPDSVGGMRHLRYLNFSRTNLTSLPESVSLLFKLQILILRACYLLETLPSNTRDLVNLRYLDVSNTRLREMPLGMKELKNLRTLSNFIVFKDSKSDLEDLRNLNFLRGELRVSGLQDVLNSHATTENILCHHKDLKVVSLVWPSQLDNSSNDEIKNHEMVLEMLQPHRNLEELTINNYGGARFPSWLGDQFSKMVILNLKNCKYCETLPCLGLLGSLEKLSIQGMASLKHLGFEIYGDCLAPFKSLKTLFLGNLQEWETWEPNKENEHVKQFASLSELSIVECPKLTGKLPYYLPSLETLVIRNCAELMVSFSSFPVLCNLKINYCKGIDYIGSPLDLQSLNSMYLSKVSEMRNWLKQGFFQVKSLSIVDSGELIYLWRNMTCAQKPLQAIQSFTFLEGLCIDNCTSLDMFPGSNFLPNLSFLKISNCKTLKSLPDGVLHNNASVESLEIGGCDSLTFIVRSMLPSSLKSLVIWNCKRLQFLVEEKEDISTASSFSSVSGMLNFLKVSNCRALKSLPEGILHNNASVESLEIKGCHSLTFIVRGMLPLSLKYVKIRNCEKLQCLVDDKEDICTSSSSSSFVSVMRNSLLEKLFIDNCPSFTCISTSGQLPLSLNSLLIWHCPKLESITESFDYNTCLKVIYLRDCEKLKSIPGGLHNLRCLENITLEGCSSVVSLPMEGLPNSTVSVAIRYCEKLEALPDRMHNLHSLETLEIRKCRNMASFPAEGLPTNLTRLEISVNLQIFKSLIEWGLHNLTSLRSLELSNCPDAVYFPQEEMRMRLPTSLISLRVSNFPKLKYLSPTCFQGLNSLSTLYISNCPKLTSLSKVELPSSLLELEIDGCPLLKIRRKGDKGKKWSNIAHIPIVEIDFNFI